MSEFKNLPSGWRVVRLGDVFDFLKTYTNSRESLNDYGEIHKKYKFYLDFRVASLPKIHQSKLGDKPEFIKNGDLVIADASEDYIDIAKSVEIKNLEHKAVAGLHTFLLRDKGDYFADGYKGYILYEPWVAKELKKKATGISVLGISKSNLLNLKIKLPPLDEQEKIAEILSTWDEAINLTINLIESKKQFKKALMQNLLTAKIRFPQFKDEWEETKLSEIFAEYTLLNTENLRQYTIGKNGIKEINDNKYEINNHKVFVRNDFIVGIGIDEMNVNLNIEKGSCSPIYNVYSTNENFVNPNFIYFYIRKAIERIKPFVTRKSTRREFEFNSSEFIKYKIKLPNLKEQQKIAEVLTACDDEINLLNLKLENLKKQKQGLMQKLLSGKVRVKYV